MPNSFEIAIIPGDGIGGEVTAAAWDVLHAAAESHGIQLRASWYPWSCDYYLEHGRMMPEDGLQLLRRADAILLGAVGLPGKVPDSVSLPGLLLPIRTEFDLYVNARPHRLLPGVLGPLRSGEFDILCIRENTEGEYSGAGGRIHRRTDQEVAVETAIFTRRGVERILRYAFEQARRRSGRVCSVTKSNALRHSMVFWDEVTDSVAKDYPEVQVTKCHIDALAARFVVQPQTLDVVVASNLFGDILTDIGAAIQGGLGFAASANINPSGGVPSMFEPVHGSAPDIAGRGIANPLGAIWSGALMLEHLGEMRTARSILMAIEALTSEGIFANPAAPGWSTRQIAAGVIARLERNSSRPVLAAPLSLRPQR